MKRLQKSFRSQYKELMDDDQPQSSSAVLHQEHEETPMDVDSKGAPHIPTKEDDEPESG